MMRESSPLADKLATALYWIVIAGVVVGIGCKCVQGEWQAAARIAIATTAMYLACVLLDRPIEAWSKRRPTVTKWATVAIVFGIMFLAMIASRK